LKIKSSVEKADGKDSSNEKPDAKISSIEKPDGKVFIRQTVFVNK
jgi:hypothetical protein